VGEGCYLSTVSLGLAGKGYESEGLTYVNGSRLNRGCGDGCMKFCIDDQMYLDMKLHQYVLIFTFPCPELCYMAILMLSKATERATYEQTTTAPLQRW
jgi:hypothetical protein